MSLARRNFLISWYCPSDWRFMRFYSVQLYFSSYCSKAVPVKNQNLIGWYYRYFRAMLIDFFSSNAQSRKYVLSKYCSFKLIAEEQMKLIFLFFLLSNADGDQGFSKTFNLHTQMVAAIFASFRFQIEIIAVFY